jgi:hypothetical protein
MDPERLGDVAAVDPAEARHAVIDGAADGVGEGPEPLVHAAHLRRRLRCRCKVARSTPSVLVVAVVLRIVGTDPPGRTFGPHAQVEVGVQRKAEVVDVVPGDQAAMFEVPLEVRNGRFTGPFVHGKGDERFVYLSWGDRVDGAHRMFRRAKVRLDHLEAAALDGRVVEARLSLTDAKGGPVCASLKPPTVAWRELDQV